MRKKARQDETVQHHGGSRKYLYSIWMFVSRWWECLAGWKTVSIHTTCSHTHTPCPIRLVNHDHTSTSTCPFLGAAVPPLTCRQISPFLPAQRRGRTQFDGATLIMAQITTGFQTSPPRHGMGFSTWKACGCRRIHSFIGKRKQKMMVGSITSTPCCCIIA